MTGSLRLGEYWCCVCRTVVEGNSNAGNTAEPQDEALGLLSWLLRINLLTTMNLFLGI